MLSRPTKLQLRLLVDTIKDIDYLGFTHSPSPAAATTATAAAATPAATQQLDSMALANGIANGLTPSITQMATSIQNLATQTQHNNQVQSSLPIINIQALPPDLHSASIIDCSHTLFGKTLNLEHSTHLLMATGCGEKQVHVDRQHGSDDIANTGHPSMQASIQRKITLDNNQ
jgi:hypothetical protein